MPADLRRATLAALLALGFAPAAAPLAGAQTYDNPNLPRSPYALPEPTYRDEEAAADAVINGNGRLHSSGQWRHWGDKRNSGETFQLLFAPNGVLDEGRTPNGLPAGRY